MHTPSYTKGMNNSFTNCINKICGEELTSLVTYKYSVFGGNTIVLEGHKGILDYSACKVSFKVGKGSLIVVGNNLQIKCLDNRFAVVVGKICSVEVAQ